MQICQKHWKAIRDHVKEKGMDHLGAKTGQEAMAAIVTSMEGRDAENEFDPLMYANWMICGEALKRLGLGLMEGDKCPICEVLKVDEEHWTKGPVETLYKEAKEKGLVQ